MSGSSSVTFSVSLDARLADRLVVQSRRAGMSRRAFVANALDFYVNVS